jgi:hypothetical protein
MPEPTPITHGELAEIIAKEVRLHAHCEGFRSISLDTIGEGLIPGTNWMQGSTINYGDADHASCDVILSEILSRMQRQYRLVDR